MAKWPNKIIFVTHLYKNKKDIIVVFSGTEAWSPSSLPSEGDSSFLCRGTQTDQSPQGPYNCWYIGYLQWSANIALSFSCGNQIELFIMC